MLGGLPVHSKWEVSAQIMGTAFTVSECTDNHNDLVILQHARQFMFHWTAFHLPLLKVIVYDLSFKGQVFPQEMIVPTLLTCSQLHVELFCPSFAASALQVSVSLGQNPTLGQQYILTCNVSVASGVTGTPTVQWVGPGSSAPIITGGDFTVSSTSPYTLTINPLRQSHAGQYTCQAWFQNVTNTASVSLAVDGMTVLTKFEVHAHLELEHTILIWHHVPFNYNPPPLLFA